MNKGLLKLSSAVLTSAMLIGAFSVDTFAGVDDNGEVYSYNETTQWYERYDEETKRTIRLLDKNAFENLCHSHLPTETGNYELGDDLTVSEGTKYILHGYDDPSYEYSQSLHIDLKGYTINYTSTNSSEYLIDLSGCQKLIYEIDDTVGSGKITCSGGAPFVLIADTNNSHYPAFNIFGGTISGINAQNVSAVKLLSNTSFTMLDGEICNFSSDKGGAFYVDTSYRGCLYLSGTSKITHCSAAEGGAIYTLSPIYMREYATIENNTASERGGAICIDGYYGNLEFDGGNPIIKNNSCTGYGPGQGGGGIFVTAGDETGNRNDYALEVDEGYPIISGNTTSGNVKNNIHFMGTSYKDSFYSDPYWLKGGDICFSLEDYETWVSSNNPIVTKISSSQSHYFHIEDPNYALVCDITSNKFYVSHSSSFTEPVIAGFSLILDGSSIGVKCHVKVPEGYNTANLKANAYLDSYDAFASDIRNKTILPDSTLDENGLLTFTYDVAPANMNTDIFFSIWDGSEAVTSETKFTITGYARVAHQKADDQKTKNIIETMVCYGAAVQLYFGHNIYSLPNSFVSEEHKANIENMDISSENLSTTISYAQAEDSPTKYYGASMLFDSSPKMKFYFINPKDASVMDDLRVTINSKPAEIQAIDDYYFAVVTDSISISDLTKGIMVTVELKSEDRLVAELSYSPMNYVARTYANSKDTNSKKMVAALWVYWKAMTSNNSDPAI